MALRIAMAQLATRVGDIDGNVAAVLEAWHRAAEQGTDLLVCTELTITGYPPEDLLLRSEFVRANLAALERLADQGPPGTAAVVGYVGPGDGWPREDTPGEEDLRGGQPEDPSVDTGHAHGHWDVAMATRDLTNSAAVLRAGEIVATYDKLRLPNYGVFDEARYFTPRHAPCVVELAGAPVGVTICEDLWDEHGPVHTSAGAGAEVVVNLNASPYHRAKRDDREAWARHHATTDDVTLVWVNAVGGQDEVVFDGDSMLLGPSGDVLARGAQFAEDLVIVDVPGTGRERADTARQRPALAPRVERERLDPVGEVWQALVTATRDYCHRNGFEAALIALSGAIDSAVTASTAADALGGEHVTGVLLPSPYSSSHSLDDARALAERVACRVLELPIDGPLSAAGELLGDLVATGFGPQARAASGREPGVAYENLQARLRGLLLMALSNEHGSIVLTTGNKSEYAVGYATLYGDMAGGFAPLKDVPKLLVYELARWRNARGGADGGEVIPTSTITKPPSAELRPDQRDDDSLPAYEVLDDIVAAHVEDELGVERIVERGHDEAVVRRVVGLIDRAEHKRRQGAPGPKITTRAFGRDRRMPISSGWNT